MYEGARKMDILNVVQSVAFLGHTFSTQSTAEHDWQAGQLLFRNISFKCKVPVFLPFIGSCKRKTEIRQKKRMNLELGDTVLNKYVVGILLDF